VAFVEGGNHFCIDDHGIVDNEVRNEGSNELIVVVNRMLFLLFTGKALLTEFDDECSFVEFFIKPGFEQAEDFDGGSNDGLGERFVVREHLILLAQQIWGGQSPHSSVLLRALRGWRNSTTEITESTERKKIIRRREVSAVGEICGLWLVGWRIWAAERTLSQLFIRAFRGWRNSTTEITESTEIKKVIRRREVSAVGEVCGLWLVGWRIWAAEGSLSQLFIRAFRALRGWRNSTTEITESTERKKIIRRREVSAVGEVCGLWLVGWQIWAAARSSSQVLIRGFRGLRFFNQRSFAL
jgi:hypothetical protein